MNFEIPDDIAEFRDVTRQIVDDLLVYEKAFHETGIVDPIVRQTLVENGYFGKNTAGSAWARWRRQCCRSNSRACHPSSGPNCAR